MKFPGSSKARAGSNSFKDLAQRSVSALLLAFAAIALTIAGPAPFAVMCAAGAVVLAYEWHAMSRKAGPDLVMIVHGLTGVAASVGTYLFGIWIGFMIVISGAVLAALLPQSAHERKWTLFGVVYLGLATSFLVALRNDPAYGLWAIFFVFLMVWTADTAAYFAGRAIGGPKLAPTISPGKTWSGFAGGLIAPAVMAFAFGYWMTQGAHAVLCLVGISLAFASQLTDLLESAIKRRYGVKDSGSIIPGHGGLFDRVDGLIGAAYAAAIIVLLRTGSIAPQSLLIW